MPHERRRTERSDFYRVMQFKPVKAPAGYSLGISRNLSYGGLSFESQVVNIEPGEALELVLKKPRSDTVISCTGSIVWKKRSDKFNTFAGIKFHDLNKTVRDNIMDMLSASGDILRDAFSHDEPAVHSAKEITETDTGSEEPAVKSVERLLFKKSEDGHESTSVSHHVNGHESKADAYSADLIQESKKQRSRKGYYIVGSLLVLTAAVFVFTSNNNKDNESPPVTSAKPISAVTAPVEKALPVNAGARQEKLEYSVQVGAWKNPEYADEMLLKLKKYYSGAYLEKKNTFHIIRIRGIGKQEQAAAIIREIERKFGLKPILVKPGQ